MIEYLLMLLLTVAIISGLNKALGEPLNKYAKNYVSDMVRCIVETGELPQKAFDICGISVSVSLNEFSIEKNSPSTKTSGFGTGSSSSGSSEGSNSSETSDRDRTNANSSKSDNDDKTNNSRDRAKSSKNSISSRPSSARTSVDDSGFEVAGTKRSLDKGTFGKADGDAEDGFQGFGVSGSGSSRQKRTRAEGVGGSFSIGGKASKGEVEDLKPATLNVTRAIKTKKSSDEEAPTGPQPFKMEDSAASRGLASGQIEEGMNFSFGNMLKWGIIIAILGIFLVFMLNQLNTIKKGWTS